MKTSITPIGPERLQQLLAVKDLTQDPKHAISQMAQTLATALTQSAPGAYPPIKAVVGSPIVQAAHNYSLLGYPEDAIVQDATYTQWVDGQSILRTQTTSLILEELLHLAPDPHACTLLAPGMVYRRDVRDRWHCAHPHQMDIWVLMPKEQESQQALMDMVRVLARAGMPGVDLDIRQASHPYTKHGIEINAKWDNQWLEVGEAGLIAPSLLGRLGIDAARWGGLAMGLGLDRWTMVAKRLPDIRLLRDPLPGVARQMGDLSAYRPVSRQPVATRELSLACMPGQTEEALVERVLDALAENARTLQTVQIKGRWSMQDLPPASVSKLGANLEQENLLIKLTWQDVAGSLPRDRVNAMARSVYRALHEGQGWGYCP